MRIPDEKSKATADGGKTLRIAVQTNGTSRIVSYAESRVPSSGDTLQCSPSTSFDLRIVKKTNGMHIIQPKPSAESSGVSLKRNSHHMNGLRPIESTRNGERPIPKRALISCDTLPPASIRQLAQSQETSCYVSLNPLVQRSNILNALEEVPFDDVSQRRGILCPKSGAPQQHGFIGITDDLPMKPPANYQSSQIRKFGPFYPGSPKSLDSTSPHRFQIETTEKSETIPGVSCRLPFNGHREDTRHYCHCEFVSAGRLLREEHEKWLEDLPSQSEVEKIVKLIIGSSCKEVMLRSKCSKSNCTSKHAINLYFNVPCEEINLFTKWFLKNAVLPDFRVILFILSRLPSDLNDTFMMVLSYAQLMTKLTNRLYRQALGIKLIGILVNVLEYKPWEAARAILIFAVTPETQLSDILDFMSSFDMKTAASTNQPLNDHVYDAFSCLWHINKSFVCPTDLLFEIVKECVAKMPQDLKLTKDRILVDLLKLPRSLLRNEFLFIDKFLDRYYPQNSEIARAFRTSTFCGVDMAKSLSERRMYETSRVKGTGPVNPQWHYWDIREARMKAFNAVVNKARKDKPPEKVDLRAGPIPGILKETPYAYAGEDAGALRKWIESGCYSNYDANQVASNDLNVEDDSECLVKHLISGKYNQVVKILVTSGKSSKASSLESCLLALRREFELCDKATLSLVVFEIFKHLPVHEPSIKRGFVRMVNSLVVDLYKKTEYTSAVKLLKVLRVVGVNHLDHPPHGMNPKTFAVVCSDSNFQCRLFPDAIRTLMYKNCMEFEKNFFSGSYADHFCLLQKLLLNMFRRFLKERHASHALDIFSLVFAAQKNLHYPINIGKYYEGVIFLSFVSGLKKNACAAGAGARLYISVERVSGNSVTFHSITYRSLLVELHRTNSPEDVVRRVLRICLKKNIYPDFSRGPVSPLVLDSHLTQEEMAIYLKHYFTYYVVQNDVQRLAGHPFVVRFNETPPPDKKLFPVSNDIMKTSRSVQDAVQRLKSALNGTSSELDLTSDASFSQDSVTLTMQGVATLLDVFKR